MKNVLQKIVLTQQGDLTLEQLHAVYQETILLECDANSLSELEKDVVWLQSKLQEQKPIYGINTGFGKLANIAIQESDLLLLQKNLIVSHAVGIGPLLENKIVRLILLLKLNSLLQGYSGIRPIIINYLLAFYHAQLWPCIPSKGSVGASGDLAPLAHLVLPLLGLGNCFYQNKKISGSEALAILNLPPLALEAKEGLALINGTQVSTAITLANLFAIKNCFDMAMQSGLLTLIASGGHENIFDERIHQIRKQPGQKLVAAKYREIVAGTRYLENKNRVQDPYSLRCQPQVMGACFDQMQFAEQILLNEASAVTDNPLLFREDDIILSGGNFHAEPVAFVADQLALIIAEIGAISERRIAFLLDHSISGLPAFLTKNPGLNSGLMIAQVTAAALASENKSLAHPASVDSIPTSANQEDHVSMATFAARRLRDMAENTAGILAIELLAACQALDLTQHAKLNVGLQIIYDTVRSIQPYCKEDVSLSFAIEKLQVWILTKDNL